ncbi:hypothetical protein KSS87_018325, partial [Heliosperma pusillum]
MTTVEFNFNYVNKVDHSGFLINPSFLDLCASRASHYAQRFVVTLNPVHSIADDLEERMSKSKRSHVHFC